MKKKTILLTGASSGFGLLTMPLLVERGHRVLAGLRGGAERLRSLTVGDEILSEAIAAGRLIALDLHMERQQTFSAAAEAVDRGCGGKLDVLINNAAYGLMGPVELHSDRELRDQFEVNFFGPVGLTRTLLPALKRAEGRVLNVSSIAGVMSFPFYGAYCASKHALEAWTEALRYELRPFKVEAGLIEPGGFKTNFPKASVYGERAKDRDSGYFERIEAFKRTIEMKSDSVNADPMVVARRMIRLCERRRLPLRSFVGKDSRTLSLLNRLLPHSAREAVTRMVFDKMT